MNSRAKGKRGEQEFCHAVAALGWPGVRRSVQYCGRSGDADVIGWIDGVHPEIKRVEKLRLDIYMEQAMRDKRFDEVPVICHKKNRGDWLVTVKLEDLKKLAELVMEHK